MVRAPCCEKMGLKKGPWTIDEDRILIAYIHSYGHGNWRALPKQAGLLRCGKSCRLRWTNYLRPDIKRGNFTKEEEDTIISLHEMLGNRWSAIAARLPGRTDNEIKNVWHTHIKKRLKQNRAVEECQQNARSKGENDAKYSEPEILKASSIKAESKPAVTYEHNAVSPPEWSYGDISSSVTDFSSMSGENNNASVNCITSSHESFDIDESFWSEALSMETSVAATEIPMKEPMIAPISEPLCTIASSNYDEDDMNFWIRILMEAGDLQDLPEL